MPNVEFLLLGKPEIKVAGTPLPKLKSEKGTALLYYLAATGQEHKRDRIAALLWGDHNDSDARNNLRTLISTHLSRPDLRAFLDVSRDTMQIQPGSSHMVDVAHFSMVARNPQATSEQLQDVFDLVRGEFLEGFVVREAEEFNQWVDAQRTWLRELILRTGVRLAIHHRQEGDFDKAMSCVERLLALDDLNEQAASQQIHLLALMGRPGDALSYYDQFAQKYEDEFGDDPPEELRKLIAKVKRGEIKTQAVVAPLPTVAAPVPTISAPPPPFQLPPQVQHFTGRERELESITTVLTRKGGGHRCALVGMGGAGKTALSTHCAYALREHFPGGVLWSQAAFGEPADILNGWAKAFGYDFSSVSDVHHRAAAMRGVLATRRVLIVLDDVVNPLQVRPLLPGGDACAVLITTRNAEIATALTAEIVPINELSLSDGLRLLDRIIAGQRGQAESQARQELCRLLSNLPLAIEIAAQLLLVRDRMSVAQMVERLRNAKQRMGLTIADREVRASFDVSWRTLDKQQQAVFCALAIFEGRSFTADALAYMLELDRYTVEDRLSELKVRSLVGEEGADRYHQHLLLADFGREKLTAPEPLYQRLALWYESFARQYRYEYEMLEPEWENLMAGMGVAHRLQMVDLVLAYADALEQAWFIQARYTQARQGSQWAAEAAQARGAEVQYARHLLNWGKACVELDEFAEANRILTLAYQQAITVEEDGAVIDARYWLARVALDRSEYAQVYPLLLENRQTCLLAKHNLGLARTNYQLAHYHYDQGRIGEAQQLCLEALQLLIHQVQIEQSPGSNLSESEQILVLRLLTDIAVEMKDYAGALQYANQALTMSLAIHDRGGIATSYYSLAFVNRFQGHLAQAQQYARQAITLTEQIGDQGLRASVLYELSRILTLQEEINEALQTAQHSMALFRTVEERHNLVRTLAHLGELHTLLNQPKEADEYWAEALEIASALHHPLTEMLQQRLMR